MIIFDSPEDIKFLDEFWKNNAGRYHKYLEKMNIKSVKKKDQSKKQS